MTNLYKIAFLLCFSLLTKGLSAQQFSKVSVSNVSVINTATFDFSPTLHKDGIVFVSNNNVRGVNKMFDKKLNEQTMSLFIAKKDDGGKLSEPQPFALELVSKVHEGPLTFEKDCKTVYLSRNDNRKRSGKARYDVDYVDYMKIYSSTLGAKGWSKPKLLSINLRKSDACHPTLSPDGKYLYFSSNRPGGFGGMDLYVSEKINGKWGKPLNLGQKINSDKNDVFPYAHTDGKLYFSSDKEGGKGGLDIYYYDLYDEGKSKTPDAFYNGTPLSIGAPFNSDKDDFGFILEENGKSGYFSSSRAGGAGGDDIYFFKEPVEKEETPKPKPEVVVVEEKKKETVKEEEPKIELKKEDVPMKRAVAVKIIDRKTGQPVQGAEVVSTNTRSNTPTEYAQGVSSPNVRTDATGTATLEFTPTDNYFIKINRPGYTTEKVQYFKDENKNEIIVFIDLEKPAVVEVKPEIRFAKTSEKPLNFVITEASKESIFKVENIYYNFDDASIRKDAIATLDALVLTLKEYPEMSIELASHTDSTGSVAYNEKLSERRANSAADYLIERGIDPSRLKSLPCGKRKLIFASPKMQYKNRRTEIRVIK
jgi:outer membrane protein OmpA-like peptidoglycan-associated protein